MFSGLPREYLLEYVSSLQTLITINIVSGNVDHDFLEETVITLDILNSENKLKSLGDRINEIEF